MVFIYAGYKYGGSLKKLLITNHYKIKSTILYYDGIPRKINESNIIDLFTGAVLKERNDDSSVVYIYIYIMQNDFNQFDFYKKYLKNFPLLQVS